MSAVLNNSEITMDKDGALERAAAPSVVRSDAPSSEVRNGYTRAAHVHDDISKDAVFMDTLMLLTSEKVGNMSEYAFRAPKYKGDPSGGAAYWEKLLENADMPATKEFDYFRDPKNLRIIPASFPRDVESISIVEIGPGTSSAVKGKTFRLLDAFNRFAGDISIEKYVAIDIAEQFAEVAAQTVSDRGIPSSALVGDYRDIGDEKKNVLMGEPKMRLDGLKGLPLAIIWGGTLWNTPSRKDVECEYVLGSQINKLGESLTKAAGSKEAYIAFTYYGSRSEKEWKQIYSHPDNTKMVESILHVMAENPLIDLDPKKFNIGINYNSSKSMLTMEAVSRETQIVSANSLCSKQLKRGDRLKLVNAYRPKEETIHGIATIANCQVAKHAYSKENGVGMFVLKYKSPSLA